jgi:1-acyl-sn-glycerol-3-phosphate acyltransferase
MASWFKWNIEGEEHLPSKGGAIVAVNHIAYLDPLAVGYVIDRLGRRPRFLGKAEIFEDRRIGWLIRGAGQIPVKRGTAEAPMALDHAEAAVRRGEIVVIFPEGTITTDPDLHPMEAKTGLARLALATKAPVIPAAVWGTSNVWTKNYSKNWRPGQDICVRFGAPMQVSGDPASKQDWAATGRQVMDAISLLVASLRAVVPDRRRPRKAA